MTTEIKLSLETQIVLTMVWDDSWGSRVVRDYLNMQVNKFGKSYDAFSDELGNACRIWFEKLFDLDLTIHEDKTLTVLPWQSMLLRKRFLIGVDWRYISQSIRDLRCGYINIIVANLQSELPSDPLTIYPDGKPDQF